MLAQVLQDAINSRAISERQAGREIGVAHTTVMRLLSGEKPSHTTLGKVAKWLGTSEEAFALIEREGDEGLAAKMLVLLQRNPRLAKALGNAADMYIEGAIPDNTLDDILNYVDFRLSQGKE
jgi:transcriptional regulator with XRE-family HTH domain